MTSVIWMGKPNLLESIKEVKTQLSNLTDKLLKEFHDAVEKEMKKRNLGDSHDKF